MMSCLLRLLYPLRPRIRLRFLSLEGEEEEEFNLWLQKSRRVLWMVSVM